VDAASVQSAGDTVAAGELISIYGLNLAPQPAGVTDGIPKPQLGGVQVSLGGQPLPLFYVGANQVNAVVPYGLPLNQPMQLSVSQGSKLSVPLTVSGIAGRPGIFTQDQSGTGLGVIVNQNYQVLKSSCDVTEGDYVTVYADGLGEVKPPVPTGTPAPTAGPLSSTINNVSVTTDGVDTPVFFAGLAPGFVGLYQINVQVPSLSSSSDPNASPTVPIVVTVAGQASAAARLPRPGKPGGTPGYHCVQ
jgi:uncharacterized protein (TIGR03437 family)